MADKDKVSRVLAEGIIRPGFLTKIKNDPQSAAGEIGLNIDQSDVGVIKNTVNNLDDSTFKHIDNLNIGSET